MLPTNAQILHAIEELRSYLVHRLDREEDNIMNQADQLSQEVKDLSDAEAAEAGIVNTALVNLQAEVDALKAGNPSIAPQLAGIQAVIDGLKAEGVGAAAADPGAQPAPPAPPAPTPAP